MSHKVHSSGTWFNDAHNLRKGKGWDIQISGQHDNLHSCVQSAVEKQSYLILQIHIGKLNKVLQLRAFTKNHHQLP